VTLSGKTSTAWWLETETVEAIRLELERVHGWAKRMELVTVHDWAKQMLSEWWWETATVEVNPWEAATRDFRSPLVRDVPAWDRCIDIRIEDMNQSMSERRKLLVRCVPSNRPIDIAHTSL